jgi:hypothetical protein
VAQRLDEQKIATLRLWADGLARDERDEMRASARAILMLIDEIELLHVELWHAGRLQAGGEAAVVEGPEDELPAERPTLRAVLRDRLRRSAEGSPAPPPPAD